MIQNFFKTSQQDPKIHRNPNKNCLYYCNIIHSNQEYQNEHHQNQSADNFPFCHHEPYKQSLQMEFVSPCSKPCWYSIKSAYKMRRHKVQVKIWISCKPIWSMHGPLPKDGMLYAILESMNMAFDRQIHTPEQLQGYTKLHNQYMKQMKSNLFENLTSWPWLWSWVCCVIYDYLMVYTPEKCGTLNPQWPWPRF